MLGIIIVCLVVAMVLAIAADVAWGDEWEKRNRIEW